MASVDRHYGIGFISATYRAEIGGECLLTTPDRVTTRILPENGLVRSGDARSASLQSLKMVQNSPKIWNGLSLGRVFTCASSHRRVLDKSATCLFYDIFTL